MILKRHFNPLKVLTYVWRELLYGLLIGFSVYVAFPFFEIETSVFPPLLLSLFGTALAIFLAFRTNTAYARWWEARTLWATVTGSSRIFARQIISGASAALAVGKGGGSITVEAYQRSMIYRHIAIAHSLRHWLREGNDYQQIQPLLSEEEFQAFLKAQNKPLFLVHRQGLKVKEGIRLEILGTFDNITLEPQLSALNVSIAMLERIKHTPLLRQYDYFTRLLLWIFITIVPFSLYGLFGGSLLFIPFSLLIAFIFTVVQRVGEVTESPFEGKIQDVPMTSLCLELERDLRELLSEPLLQIPSPTADGYLY